MMEKSTGQRQRPLPALRILLVRLMKFKNAWIFNEPVDVTAVPDYLSVISKPMDLGTIKKKLETGGYNGDEAAAVSDIRLVWDNAKRYNPPDSPVFRYAEQLSLAFEQLLLQIHHNTSPASISSPTILRSPSVTTGRHEKAGRESRAVREAQWSVSSEAEDEDEDEDEDDNDVDNIDDEQQEQHSEGSNGLPEEEREEPREASALQAIVAHRFVAANTTEFYVKWRSKSYANLEWVPQYVLEEQGFVIRIRKYFEKKTTDLTGKRKEEYANLFFPPEYLEIDRIIGEREEPKKQLLVKWTALPYSQATWEDLGSIANDQKIDEYAQFNKSRMVTLTTNRQKQTIWKQLEESPSYKGSNQLRPYQLEGLNWLCFCWYQNRGSILADEMGLGKTVQSVVFMNQLWKEENIGPFLVVAPLSTIPHWYREFSGWTDMNCVVYHGQKTDRDIIRQFEWYYKGDLAQTKRYKFDVILTTYEMLLASDSTELTRITWASVIVDEAQRLKSHKSKLTTVLHGLKVQHKVLLTGTPLQNNTQELWTLLNFIDTIKFHSVDEFLLQFGKLETSEQVSRLHSLLKPHLLRRLKEDVEKSIPPKEETIVEVELTNLQKQYYKALMEKNRNFLVKGCNSTNFPSMMNIMMQLRKVCNHPYLIEGVEEKEREKLGLPHQGIDYQKQYLRKLIEASGKLILVDKLLPKLHAGGHRVLIFSQMVRVLDLIEQYLSISGWKYERIDGSIKGNDRQAAIDRFSNPNSASFAFLLCTRAGGIGINLASADTVIIYDSDWNPQNDIQAQARCHRIGQKKDVKVYRLICRQSYETEMFERASMKLGLDQAVLSNIGQTWDESNRPSAFSGRKTMLVAKEIDNLLKRGAYDIFKEEDNSNSKKFSEEDIDQILNRAKVLASTELQLDINAKDFWLQILPEENNAANLYKRFQLLSQVSSNMDHAQKTKLYADIHSLFKETVQIWTKSTIPPDQATSNLQQLTALVEECKSSAIFNDKEKKELTDWLTRLGEIGKRKRRLTDRIGISDTNLTADLTEPHSKKSKKGGPVDPTKWSRFERKRFVDVFMALGSGRWEQLKEDAKLSNKTTDSIRIYANCLLKKCIDTDPEDSEFFTQLLELKEGENLEAPLFNNEPSFNEAQYSELIRRKAKNWKNRLQVVQLLRELSEKDQKDQVVPDVPEKRPTVWWTHEDDKSLVKGSLLYGFGQYSKMLTDTTLSWTKRPANIGPVPSQVQDHDLDDDEKELEKGDPDTAWIPRNLDYRLKTLLTLMLKPELLPVKVGRKFNKGLRKEDGGPGGWTKQEKLDIKRTLMMYGRNYPKIKKKAHLEERAIEEVEEFVDQLIEYCKSFLVQPNGKSIKPKKATPNGEKIEDDDEDENEAVDADAADVEEMEEPVEEKAENDEMDENGEEKNNLDDQKKSVFSYIIASTRTARNIISRTELMDKLRLQILASSQLNEHLAHAMRGNLPEWWEAGKHDLALLKSVAKHGMGSKKSLKKKEHPLFTHDDQSVSKPIRKIRKKFLKDFLEDKAALVLRIKYLCRLVEEGPSIHKRDKNRKRKASEISTRTTRSRDEATLPDANDRPVKVATTRVVLRDPTGRPLLPLSARGASVINLGRIVPKPGFHNKNYLWPLGFESTRQLPSLLNPGEQTLYHSKIEEDAIGDAPVFVVWAEDQPTMRFVYPTSSAVWVEVLKKIKKRNTVSVSGPEMFGYADPTIQMLFQELHGASDCTAYVRKQFADSSTATPIPSSTPKTDSVTAVTPNPVNPLQILNLPPTSTQISQPNPSERKEG